MTDYDHILAHLVNKNNNSKLLKGSTSDQNNLDLEKCNKLKCGT